MTGRVVARASEPDRCTGETRTAETELGHTVAYAEYGDPTGTPLVAFHGTPGSRLFGALLDEAARERGVRVIAIDRPGYGRSDYRPEFGPTDVGEVVVPVLDALDIIETCVLGFSGGSEYALGLAATRPERVRDVVIVSGATPPSLQETTPRPLGLLAGMARRTPRLLGVLLRGQAWLARRYPSVVVGQYADPDGIPDTVAECVAADFRGGLATSRAGAVAEFERVGSEWAVPLAGVECPVELWHGSDDENVPIEGVRRLADRLPNGSLTVLDGTDHLETVLSSRTAVLRTVRQRSSSSKSTS